MTKERRKMRSKNILIIGVVLLLIAFSIVRFSRHTGITASSDYKDDVYVRRVIDGDTIELSSGQTVRYIGIDAPELREKIKDVWIYKPRPYAEKARDINRKLVEGKPVRLEFDVQKRDKYSRLLAYVYSDDVMVNLEMLRQGYAMIYTSPPNVKYIEDFLKAQKEARDGKKGFWRRLERNLIYSSGAKDNVGLIKMVETEVINTYLSDSVLILNCRDKFKVVIFKRNLIYFPKAVLRSPDSYFKNKTIRVYGVIKDYKGATEIIIRDPSQLEIV